MYLFKVKYLNSENKETRDTVLANDFELINLTTVIFYKGQEKSALRFNVLSLDREDMTKGKKK